MRIFYSSNHSDYIAIIGSDVFFLTPEGSMIRVCFSNETLIRELERLEKEVRLNELPDSAKLALENHV